MEVMPDTGVISVIEDIPGLFLSDVTVPRSPERLKAWGITHVLSLVGSERECPRVMPSSADDDGMIRDHIWVPVDDNPLEDLLVYLDGLCAWIERALHGGRRSAHPVAEVGGDGGDSDGARLGGGERRGLVETTCTADVGNSSSTPPSAGSPHYNHHRVLVHCLQGVSRSAAVVLAYLMRARHLDYDAALARLRQHRPAVLPNSGFADQLRLWHELGYQVFETTAGGGDGNLRAKPPYEAWLAGRGVLLSREQERRREAALAFTRGMVGGR